MRKVLCLSGILLFSAIAVFAGKDKFNTKQKTPKDTSYGIPLSEVADKIEQVYLYTNSFDNVSDIEFGNLGTLVNEEAVRASIYLLEGNKVLFLPENKENTQVSLNGKTYGMYYSTEKDGYLFYILKDWRLVESGVPVNSIESSCIQYCTVNEHDEGAATSGTEHDRPKPFVPDYDGEYVIDDLAYLGEIELSFPEDELVKIPLVNLDNNEYIDEVISCISDTLREKEKYGSYNVRVGEYRRIFDKYGETTMGYVTTVITGNGLKEYASFEVIDNGNGYDAFPVNGLSLENSPFLFMRNEYDEDIVRKVEKVSENVIHLEVEEDSVSMPEKRSPIYDEKYFDFRSMDLDEITDIVENVCCYCDWFGMYELGYQEGKLRELNQEELIVYSWHNTGKTLFFIPEKMVNMAMTGKDGQEYPLYVNDKGEIELYMLEWNPYAEKKGQLGTTYVSHHTFGSGENNGVEYLIKLGNIHVDLNKTPSVDPVEADDEYILALEEHVKELFKQNQKEGGFEIYLGEYEALHTNKVCVSAAVIGSEEEYYVRYLIVRSGAGKYDFWPVGFGADDSLEESKSTAHQMNKRCIEKIKYLNRRVNFNKTI